MTLLFLLGEKSSARRKNKTNLKNKTKNKNKKQKLNIYKLLTTKIHKYFSLLLLFLFILYVLYVKKKRKCVNERATPSVDRNMP